ncbi:hypothetical protein [Brevundimonas sp. M20]|uniref:hypothetical protein n=1 Tax=Brevundimonas sp. M20 TaxID=2591463 RepID=UPI00114772CA|nr:hypothetical protein [Brevundimonas sp. M20]QDH73587.1 hypothetical protein FKQ52_09195 [Brevundimonas sp. M20]
MKRIEPNLLLAISTASALILVLATIHLFGAPGQDLRNILLVIICTGGFVLLNPIMLKMMKIAPRPPLIHPDSPSTMLWAALFPMAIILAAAVPVFWPGQDYGLLVLIAAVWFGATVESALKVLRPR